jgi:hypothetical protein
MVALQPEKHIFPKLVYRRYETYNTNKEPLKPNSQKNKWGTILHKEEAYTIKRYQ